jgi:hypothetical protein
MEDSYYIVIQGWMRMDLQLAGNDLIVFAAVWGYSQDGNGCYYGKQERLAEICGVSLRTLKGILASLIERGLLTMSTTAIDGHIRNCYAATAEVQKLHSAGCRNCTPPGAEIAPNNKDNNKDSLSIEREARAREEKGGKFVKPTADEVAAYAAEKGIALDADHFVAHYTSNGWKVGKAPMKDWRAAVVAWSKREGEFRRPAAPAAAAQTAEDVAKHPNAVWDRMAKEGRI